jgi:hypothetical protein
MPYKRRPGEYKLHRRSLLLLRSIRELRLPCLQPCLTSTVGDGFKSHPLHDLSSALRTGERLADKALQAGERVADDGAKDFEGALKDAAKTVKNMSPSQIGHDRSVHCDEHPAWQAKSSGCRGAHSYRQMVLGVAPQGVARRDRLQFITSFERLVPQSQSLFSPQSWRGLRLVNLESVRSPRFTHRQP